MSDDDDDKKDEPKRPNVGEVFRQVRESKDPPPELPEPGSR